MAIGDMITIGIVIFFVILGLLGTFKWMLNILAGAVCGLIVIVGISLLVDNIQFDKLSNGIFKDGVIIPQIKQQIEPIQDCFGQVKVSNESEILVCNRDGDPITAKVFTESVRKNDR